MFLYYSLYLNKKIKYFYHDCCRHEQVLVLSSLGALHDQVLTSLVHYLHAINAKDRHTPYHKHSLSPPEQARGSNENQAPLPYLSSSSSFNLCHLHSLLKSSWYQRKWLLFLWNIFSSAKIFPGTNALMWLITVVYSESSSAFCDISFRVLIFFVLRKIGIWMVCYENTYNLMSCNSY